MDHDDECHVARALRAGYGDDGHLSYRYRDRARLDRAYPKKAVADVMSKSGTQRVLSTSPSHGSGEIRLVNISKQFGDSYAVRDINLTIPHGSYCCLLGPSGCGKTTILRMIAGHETPTSGEVWIG